MAIQTKKRSLRMQLGMDITDQRVVAIGIVLANGECQLAKAEMAECHTSNEAGKAVGRLWRNNRANALGAQCSLGDSVVVIQQAELPDMSDDELMSAVELEAEQLIPNLSDMSFDAQILGRNPRSDVKGPTANVLLVAASNDSVNHRYNFILNTGADVISIVPSGLAIANAVAEICPPAPGTIRVLADVSANTTHFVAVPPPGKPVAPVIREINAGSALFAGHFAEQDSDKRIKQANWLRDIERSVAFASDRLDAPASELMIVGDGADSGSMMDWMSQSLQMPVAIWNPLDTMQIAKDGPSLEEVAKWGHHAAVALGLALMEEGQ